MFQNELICVFKANFKDFVRFAYFKRTNKVQYTNDPENYHHLHVLKDYAIKDKSNYYDQVMPLNGPQEVESEHYGNLTDEENGAYLTVTNTNKT